MKPRNIALYLILFCSNQICLAQSESVAAPCKNSIIKFNKKKTFFNK